MEFAFCSRFCVAIVCNCEDNAERSMSFSGFVGIGGGGRFVGGGSSVASKSTGGIFAAAG